MRPGSTEARDALAQLEQGQRADALADLQRRAAAAEREERWAEALKLHEEALKIEPSLEPAQAGRTRSQPRARLDEWLEALLAMPERLWTPPGRDAARAALKTAEGVPAPGPRLAGQTARLQALLDAAEIPVRVALQSDTFTAVVIYRVGSLGTFAEREIELKPGRYTIVGRRAGLSRRATRGRGGARPPAALVTIRCEEPI